MPMEEGEIGGEGERGRESERRGGEYSAPPPRRRSPGRGRDRERDYGYDRRDRGFDRGFERGFERGRGRERDREREQRGAPRTVRFADGGGRDEGARTGPRRDASSPGAREGAPHARASSGGSDSDDPGSGGATPQLLEDQALEEERQIAERRRRRAEMMERHRAAQAAAAPTATATGSAAATPSTTAGDAMAPAAGPVPAAPPAPARDPAQGPPPTAGAAPTEPAPSSDDEADMFADDFEETVAGRAAAAGGGVEGLKDSWDDAEGYYNFRVGELLDGRYEVYANYGRGVFSTVLRARDLAPAQQQGQQQQQQEQPSEVAIKVIRANETMRKAAQLEVAIVRKLAGADPEGRRHCVRLLAHFEHREHTCMVFEPLARNLREVLKKFGRNIGLNLGAVRAYAHPLLIALKHIYNCGVIHAGARRRLPQARWRCARGPGTLTDAQAPAQDSRIARS